MTTDPHPEAWARARYDYEQTDKPVDDICFELGVSPNTLRDRVRRWRWVRRRQPISAEGPPPMQPIEQAAPLAPALTLLAPGAPLAPALPGDLAAPSPAPQAAPSEETPPDPAVIVPRLQGAVARVLPAIEATIAKLAAGPMHPREMERAARTLTALTRTLRELNGLLGQQQVHPAGARMCDCDMPEDIDAFRIELARRIEAFVDSRTSDEEWELRGRPPKGFVPYGA